MTNEEVEGLGATGLASFTFINTPDWVLNPEGYWIGGSIGGSPDVMSESYSNCWLYEECFFYVRPVIEISVDELN